LRPKITAVDLSGYTGKPGEMIRMEAVDDFEVVSVSLVVARLDGTLIENGAAAATGAGNVWVYTTTAAAPAGQTLLVHVTAADRPGNQTTHSRERTV
jgi:hypothetical protein